MVVRKESPALGMRAGNAGPERVQCGAGLVRALLSSKASRGVLWPPPSPDESRSPGKTKSMFDVIATKRGHHGNFSFAGLVDLNDGDAGLAVDQATRERDVVVKGRAQGLKGADVTWVM